MSGKGINTVYYQCMNYKTKIFTNFDKSISSPGLDQCQKCLWTFWIGPLPPFCLQQLCRGHFRSLHITDFVLNAKEAHESPLSNAATKSIYRNCMFSASRDQQEALDCYCLAECECLPLVTGGSLWQTLGNLVECAFSIFGECSPPPRELHRRTWILSNGNGW